MNSSAIVKMMTNLINKKFYDGRDQSRTGDGSILLQKKRKR